MHKGETLLLVLMLVCTCGPTLPEPTTSGAWRCTLPPETFQASDLVGTWHAISEAGVVSDVLVLREGGTYRQVYEKSSGYRYESDWNRWWIEQRDSGGLYLHLDHMRYCDLTDEDCRRPGGGGGDWPFWDPCENRPLEMRGEVILTVRGTEGSRHPLLENAPRGIYLRHMQPNPDTSPGFFALVSEGKEG
jgi:hypothetical protein